MSDLLSIVSFARGLTVSVRVLPATDHRDKRLVAESAGGWRLVRSRNALEPQRASDWDAEAVIAMQLARMVFEKTRKELPKVRMTRGFVGEVDYFQFVEVPGPGCG